MNPTSTRTSDEDAVFTSHFLLFPLFSMLCFHPGVVGWDVSLICFCFSSSHCINQILESVSHIHQHDIVHRDLKVSWHILVLNVLGPICTLWGTRSVLWMKLKGSWLLNRLTLVKTSHHDAGSKWRIVVIPYLFTCFLDWSFLCYYLSLCPSPLLFSPHVPLSSPSFPSRCFPALLRKQTRCY